MAQRNLFGWPPSGRFSSDELVAAWAFPSMSMVVPPAGGRTDQRRMREAYIGVNECQDTRVSVWQFRDAEPLLGLAGCALV